MCFECIQAIKINFFFRQRPPAYRCLSYCSIVSTGSLTSNYEIDKTPGGNFISFHKINICFSFRAKPCHFGEFLVRQMAGDTNHGAMSICSLWVIEVDELDGIHVVFIVQVKNLRCAEDRTMIPWPQNMLY